MHNKSIGNIMDSCHYLVVLFIIYLGKHYYQESIILSIGILMFPLKPMLNIGTWCFFTLIQVISKTIIDIYNRIFVSWSAIYGSYFISIYAALIMHNNWIKTKIPTPCNCGHMPNIKQLCLSWSQTYRFL